MRSVALCRKYFIGATELLQVALNYLCDPKATDRSTPYVASQKIESKGIYRLLCIWISVAFEDFMLKEMDPLVDNLIEIVDKMDDVNVLDNVVSTQPLLKLQETTDSFCVTPPLSPPSFSSDLQLSASEASFSVGPSAVPDTSLFVLDPKELLRCQRVYEMRRQKQSASYDVDKHLLHCCFCGDDVMARYLIYAHNADYKKVIDHFDIEEKYVGIFLKGDTAISIATRFNNQTIADFISSLGSRDISKANARSSANDSVSSRSALSDFAEDRAQSSISSFDSFERGRKSYVSELRRKLKWVTRVRQTRESLMEPMDLIPFYIRSSSVQDIHSFLFFQKAFTDNFADHFLIWTHQMQTRLSPHEIATYPLSYSSGTQSPLLLSYSSFVNDVSRWVEVIVLSEWEAKDRAKNVEFFISLMEKLMTRRCYLACMGVGVGLQSAFISRLDRQKIFHYSLDLMISFLLNRLKNTWASVDPADVAKFEEINGVFSPSKNFAEYRKIVSEVERDSRPAACMLIKLYSSLF